MKSEVSFRESVRGDKVEVCLGGRMLKSFSEYRTAAEYAQRTFKLSDTDLVAIYEDYKEHDDAR